MTRVLETLFETYGETIMRKYDLREDPAIMRALDDLPLDRTARVELCDLLSGHYFRCTAAAFAIGLHLGLSLMEPSPGP